MDSKTVNFKGAIQLHANLQFRDCLNEQFQKKWVVHCAKPQKNVKKIVGYLGRYIKRPPIALSKLKHYDGHNVKFRYLNHTLKKYQTFEGTVSAFIARFIQHIPDKGFRLIRYYGLLANRVKGNYLPIVNNLLGNENQILQQTNVYWTTLLLKTFNKNPLVCEHCGNPLLFQFNVFPQKKECRLD